MSTNPINPVPVDPDQNPDEAQPVVRTVPGDDAPLSTPAVDPDEDPDEQLPRDS